MTESSNSQTLKRKSEDTWHIEKVFVLSNGVEKIIISNCASDPKQKTLCFLNEKEEIVKEINPESYMDSIKIGIKENEKLTDVGSKINTFLTNTEKIKTTIKKEEEDTNEMVLPRGSEKDMQIVLETKFNEGLKTVQILPMWSALKTIIKQELIISWLDLASGKICSEQIKEPTSLKIELLAKKIYLEFGKKYSQWIKAHNPKILYEKTETTFNVNDFIRNEVAMTAIITKLKLNIKV